MKDPKLSSFVGEYIDFRLAYIKDMKWEADVVRRFTTFADRRRERIVTRKLLSNYFESFKNPAPTTKFNECRLIRQFCIYLCRRDERHFVPEYRFFPKPKSKFKPYIYTEEEVVRMMNHARHDLWQGPQRLVVPAVYETLIGLLWVTGIRMSEAVNLNLGDLDFKRNLLYIRETKFYKSRLVPVHSSTMAALKNYIEERNSFGFPKEPDRPLFFNWRMRRTKKWRYTVDAFHEKIREIILALNLKHKTTGRYARPYDLRHSFATSRLERIYEDGNPIQRLPLIATYMGHAKLTYTQTYLHPSTELMAGLGKNFFSFFEKETA
jgi:integrase